MNSKQFCFGHTHYFFHETLEAVISKVWSRGQFNLR